MTYDVTAPTGTLTLNTGATTTSSTSVQVDFTTDDLSSLLYITNDINCASGGQWQSYIASIAKWDLAQTNALATVYAKFQDLAGNESPCYSATITQTTTDTTTSSPATTVANASISLEADATYTRNSTVSVTLAATNATEMYLSDAADCTGGSWEPFATSTTWNLSKLNQTVTVYAKFRDTALAESACTSDSIIHDSIAPTSGSLTINGNAATTQSTSVTLTIQATDANQMYITNTSGCATGGTWESFTTNKTWALGQIRGTATVYAAFKDVAGNTSSCINATIRILDTPTAVAVGNGSGQFTCSLLNGGNVKCWGYNSTGQLGVGNTTDLLAPGAAALDSGAIALAPGQDSACALLNDGTVKCWGNNNIGQLGIGNTTSSTSPGNAVSGLSNVTAIASGDYSSCALSSDGSVKCWGYNSEGQIGIGNTATVTAPSTATFSSGVTAISVGPYRGCAVLNGGTVKCWGDDFYGALGVGTSGSYTTAPNTAVIGISTATAVSVGYGHVCALLSDGTPNNGTIKCWGSNNSGQLGIGNTSDIHQPGAAVTGITTAVAVSASYGHTCALLADGSVKCWGSNYAGQLGVGYTSALVNAPGTAALASGATAISAGYTHTCALLSGGSIKCWGRNTKGQLGTGDTSQLTAPGTAVSFP